MNKKLIAAAIAAGIAAPMVANAGVTVYGVAQLELTNAKLEGSSPSSTTALTDSKNSRFGIKWSEDLGGGLSAIGQMEYAPNLFDGASKANSAPYARLANMGLKGSFGEVRFGTNKQPYKYSGGVKYDAFVATAAEARSGNGGMLASSFGQNGYFANSISYKGKFNNVQVWVATSVDQNADSGNKYSGSDGDLMASVVVGLAKGAEVGVAMANDKYASGATSGAAGAKNTKIFGKYTFGASQILAQYETSDVTTTNGDSKVMFLGYRFNMGSNIFAAQFGKTDTDQTNNGGDLAYMAVGAIHKLSKKTRAFVAYRKTDDKSTANADVTAITLGMTTKF